MMAFVAQPQPRLSFGLARRGATISKPLPFHYRGRSVRITGASGGYDQMSKDELIIQLVKIALGILIAGYFLWWSLEVLKRLPPAH